MRSPSGTRSTVDKFIQAINKRMDDDLILEYIKDIASYYTSEYKTKEDILSTLESDIQSLMFCYRICCQASGHDEVYNKQMSQFKIEFIPNKAAEIPMRNISWGVMYLIREAAYCKVYLEPDKLEKLGLKCIPDPLIFNNNEGTLYDFAIRQYGIHGFIKPVPQAPLDVLKCFENKTFYESFYQDNKGRTPKEMAVNFYNLEMSVDFLKQFKAYKAFYDYFVDPDEHSPSYEDYKPAGANIIGDRQFKNYMRDARESILGE